MSENTETVIPFESLAAVVSHEPGIDAIAGSRNSVIAVPEAARAAVLAGITRANGRRPIVIATPTGTMAQEVADDLAAFLGESSVELFPAWETLPFERVSPAVHTMGARMRTMWRLRNEDECPP